MIEEIKRMLEEKGVNPVIEFHGVVDVMSTPVKYADCNLSDWSDFHGVKELHVLVYSTKKLSLVIMQSDCNYGGCNHVGMTVLPVQSINGVVAGLSKSKGDVEVVKRTVAKFVNDVVPNLIVYDVVGKDGSEFVIEDFSDRLLPLVDVVIQMMMDGIDYKSIIEFMCEYRGVIQNNWKERINKKVDLSELEKHLDKDTIKAINSEVEKIEESVKKSLDDED